MIFISILFNVCDLLGYFEPTPVKTPESSGLASIMKDELQPPTATPKVNIPESENVVPEDPKPAVPNDVPMDPSIVVSTQEKAVEMEQKAVPPVEASKPEIPNIVPVDSIPKPIDPLPTEIPTASPTPASEQDDSQPLTTPAVVELPTPPVTTTPMIDIPTIVPIKLPEPQLADNIPVAKPVEQPIRSNIPDLIYDQIRKVTEIPSTAEAAIPPKVEPPVKIPNPKEILPTTISPKIEEIPTATFETPKVAEIPTTVAAPIIEEITTMESPKVEEKIPENNFEEEKVIGSVLKDTIHQPKIVPVKLPKHLPPPPSKFILWMIKILVGRVGRRPRYMPAHCLKKLGKK